MPVTADPAGAGVHKVGRAAGQTIGMADCKAWESGASEAPWPEIEPPPGVDCVQFGLAGHGRLVWAEGDPHARLLILLDNPGAREDPQGRPWVCGTRRTLRRALADAGLAEEPVYLTFLVKCRPRRAYDRSRAHAVGMRYVWMQLAQLRPAVMVLLGDVVVRAMTGDGGASVRALRGRPLRIAGVAAVVGYHPLAARRRPVLYPLLVQDLVLAAMLLRQEGQPDAAAVPGGRRRRPAGEPAQASNTLNTMNAPEA